MVAVFVASFFVTAVLLLGRIACADAACCCRCSVVCVCVCVSACVCLLDTRESYKNGEPIEMLLGCGLWNRVLGGGPDALGKGPFSWLSPPLKCIILCKQQIPEAAQGCRFVHRSGASRHKRGFLIDSPTAWVTGVAAMRPFITVLWPLVIIVIVLAVECHSSV